MEGLSKVISMVKYISQNDNQNLRFLLFLINSVDKRTSISKIIIDKVENVYGEDMVFKNKIPKSTAI